MSDLPKFVMVDKDRHGNVRRYFRRGGRKVRLVSDPDTEAFLEEIRACLEPGAVLEFKARKNLKSCVYFVLHGSKRVKIGTTTELNRRYAAIRTGVPGASKIHYVTPGDSRLEAELHRMFADDRMSGEWFIYSRHIRDWIAEDKARRLEEAGAARPNKERTLSRRHCPTA